MIARLGLFTFAMLVAAGCAGQPATVTTSPPTATAAVAAAAKLSEQEALALADKFYDLCAMQQDYARALALFDDKMKAAITESQLKEIWTILPQQVGAFQTRSAAILADRKGPYQRVIIPLQFEKASLNMLVVIDVTTGKISGLFFQPKQGS